MRCIKLQLVIEFGEYNIATMVYALDILSEMIVSIKTNKLNDLLEKKTPYEKNFIIYLVLNKLSVLLMNMHLHISSCSIILSKLLSSM